MKCLKTKINYSKDNKNRDWSNVAFTNESRFYLHNSGISIRTLKEENNIDKKKNSINACIGAYWSEEAISLEILKETLIVRNTQVYWKIELIRLKKYFKKWRLQWDNDSKLKRNVSLKLYIKNKSNKMASL